MKKNIKTATITFNNAYNWGAILQTYALQKTIKNSGFDNDIINYSCPCIDDGYKAFSWNKCRNMKLFLHMLLECNSLYRKNVKFSGFIDKYMSKTRIINRQAITDIVADYDVFITGSDQVFNYVITGEDESFLLGFSEEKNKNISYAASFGLSHIPADKESWYRKYLSNFLHITCREQTGHKIIKNLIEKNTAVVLDPVFLLDKPNWKSIASCREKALDYIFVYMATPDVVAKAELLGQKYNLRVINLLYEKSLMSIRSSCENVYDAGPEEFVGYIKNAKMVLTGSFHATAFSLIFHRPLLVKVPDKVGSRITDLLEMFQMSDCIMKSDSIEPVDVNWKRVDKILAEKRQESLDYLKYMIDDSVEKQREKQ